MYFPKVVGVQAFKVWQLKGDALRQRRIKAHQAAYSRAEKAWDCQQEF